MSGNRYSPDNLGTALVRTGPKSRQGQSPYFLLPALARSRFTGEFEYVSVAERDGLIVLLPGENKGFAEYHVSSAYDIAIGAAACHALAASPGDQVRIHDWDDMYPLQLVSEDGGPQAGETE